MDLHCMDSIRTKSRKVKAMVADDLHHIKRSLLSPNEFVPFAAIRDDGPLEHNEVDESSRQHYLINQASSTDYLNLGGSNVSLLNNPNEDDSFKICSGSDSENYGSCSYSEPNGYSSCSSDDDNDDGTDDYPLTKCLAEWAGVYNISHAALSGLLSLLQKAGVNVPKDPRTLLATPKHTDVVTRAGGSYYYFGIANTLQKKMGLSSEIELKNVDVLSLHINIDGLPLSSSSSLCLWPIIGMICQFDFGPFLIAAYSGYGKPSSITEFMQDFASEFRSISEQGFECNGKNFKLVLKAVICDAPARAYVKCIKGHSGYNSCERCIQEGLYIDCRMTFPETDANERTDANFRTMQFDDHHTGVSPFMNLDVGCVSDFPLDYMHLVCLGVVRRTISQWLKGPLNCRLSGAQVKKVSENLTLLRRHLPREFCRKPRALSEVNQWKATEFRQFLLYTGAVVLLGVLPPSMYDNFKLLLVSMTILLSPSLSSSSDNLDYVSKLLKVFVETYAKIYGKNQLIYNVHSIIHLPDDARKHGSLDNISSFPFETFLGKVKKMVRRPQNPVAQLVKRVSESHHANISKRPLSLSQKLRRCHSSGPLPSHLNFSVASQYKDYKLDNGTFVSCAHGNNCISVDGVISLIRNICVSPGGDAYVIYEKFQTVRSFFTAPLDSAVLGIHIVSHLAGEVDVMPIFNIQKKYVLLPIQNDEMVALPLLHL